MKTIKTVILLLVVTVLSVGMSIPNAEAAFGNQNQNQNMSQNMSQNRYQNMSQQDKHDMLRLLTKLRSRLHQLLRLRNISYSDSVLQIATRQAYDIGTNSAVLRGRVVDFNQSDYADVWFLYGNKSDELNKSTTIVRLNNDEDQDFERKITDLNGDTLYYFQAVGEDDTGGRDYGVITNFRTESISYYNPVVSTRSAINVTDDSAELRGTVDMNDFNNGEVFFVYGKDENKIVNVQTDFSSYLDVDEDGDNLQKVLVDTNLDTSDSYIEKVTSLDSNVNYYFNICVGYENDSNDDVIKCGNVRNFATN